MTHHYLIVEKSAHTLIHIVQGDTLTDALWNYIVGDQTEAARLSDGSVVAWGATYPHPLAYIERWSKIEGEWSVRALADRAWSASCAQVHVDKGPDDTAAALDACLAKFVKRYPKADAEWFVWPLKTGTLVTFYQKKHLDLKVMKRYLYHWNGKKETVAEWKGDYAQLAEELDTQPVRSLQETTSRELCGVGF